MYEDPEDVRMKVWTSAVVAAIACSSLVLTAQTPADRAAAQRQAEPNEGRPQPGPRLKIERDLEYSRAGSQALTLDLYRPDPVPAPTPVVVWIHGMKGGDATKATSPAVALTTSGYAIASIDYRGTAPIAARVADAKAAVRWLRANAPRFNVDPAKVGVFGYDSGATVAEILGTAGDVAALEGEGGTAGQTTRVQTVVAAAGPVDRSDAINAIAYVTKDDAPMLLLHGTADAVVPTLQSQALISALKVAGVDSTLELQIGAPHVLKANGHRPTWCRSNALAPASRAVLRGIDLHFHDLRHEAGSRFIEGGWPIHHVQEMLAHKNVAQTSTI